MSRSTDTRTVFAILGVAALFSAIALGATAVFGRTITPAPQPTDPPIVEPSTPPTTPPTPAPSDPSSPPTDVFVVDLDTTDQNEVTVVIDDETGTVVGATSGEAGDGMSVRWNTIRIDAIDADTLQLTWAGWPQDEVIDVVVAKGGVGYFVTFTQKMPYPNTDAMGADRVLIIDFASTVDPSDVEADFVAAN